MGTPSKSHPSRSVGRGGESQKALVSSPVLAALGRAGTRHVYADTGDRDELAEVLAVGEGGLLREVDGNTVNQPLVQKVLPRILEEGDPSEWVQRIGESGPDLAPYLYGVVCARIGNELRHAFARGRHYEVSLQLHMRLGARYDESLCVGRALRRLVPDALVKVPFRPDAPQCLFVARDLERAGFPVNLTSTFSARQVAVAALFCEASRTNVFMGRIDQGLEAELLGEHVDLEAQRTLADLRRCDGVATQLIVASMHDWRTFVRAAGCDVFTAPCDVLRDWLEQDEVAPEEVTSRLETSYRDVFRVSQRVRERLGDSAIARLWEVEPALLEFLRELRDDEELAHATGGDRLFERFDEAGFGDLFHAPSDAQRAELGRGKLPELDGELVDRVPLDTHYSLLANADFERHQEAIDAAIADRVG